MSGALRGALAGMRARNALRRCDAVGHDVDVAGPLDIENLGTIRIGDGVRLGGAGAPTHLVTGPNGELTIGSHATIGHGVGIAAHTRVSIGANANIGPFTLLLDTDFHVAGDHDSAGSSTPIEIGAGAQIGARVVVLRGARIGASARVGAGSVVSGEVPAGAYVTGVPARAPMAASSASTTDDGGREPTPERVRAVVAATLGLPTPPRDDQGPHDLAQWDSLGTLTLLLALEARFDVALAADDMVRVKRVGDLPPLLATRRAEAHAA